MMYSFLFTYTLKNEIDRDRFLSELISNKIDILCSSEDGCYIYKYVLPVGEPEKLCIIESWRDKKAQEIHCAQAHCKIIRALKEKYGVISTSFCLSDCE